MPTRKITRNREQHQTRRKGKLSEKSDGKDETDYKKSAKQVERWAEGKRKRSNQNIHSLLTIHPLTAKQPTQTLFTN